jgi:hypothetical protein
MKPFIFLAMLSCISLCLQGQKHDYIWYMGYSLLNDPLDTMFGTSVVDFSGLPERVEAFYNPSSKIDFYATNAGMADYVGNLLFYFNGLYIEDVSGEKMLDGDQINFYDSTDIQIGYSLPQGGIALPRPEKPGRYVLFHQTLEFLPFGEGYACTDLRYSEIDMAGNGGLGAVVDKRVLVLEDTLNMGQLTAVRHANGRDWWLLAPRKNSNEYYRIRLAPEGVINEGLQAVGLPVPSGLGQGCFSPDGEWYVRFNTISASVGEFVDVYAFDRCTGLLSEHRRVRYNNVFVGAGSGGAAIAPDSRYLYISSNLHIYQFDLWAADLEASWDTVAVYDGYQEGGYLATRFFLAQLGPDGKIYINSPNGVHTLHVIHRPDEAGQGCQVEQRGFRLPTPNASSIPNFPNYRLGPLEGSPCDTLGLANWPLARWRSERDSLEVLRGSFFDLSAYEPTSWHWDFGDGSSSAERHPEHLFPAPGLYEVCLTVSNAHGSDTSCRELQFGTITSTAGAPLALLEARVYPNPFAEAFTLSLPEGWQPASARLSLYDQLGRRRWSQRLQAGANEVRAGHLPAGVYFWAVEQGGAVLARGRVLKR